MRIPNTFNTVSEWNNLRWSEFTLSSCNKNRSYPLVAEGLSAEPGIYQMTWTNLSTWKKMNQHIEVDASPFIEDPTLDFSETSLPLCLTVGKSVNLRNRIRQHFGFNENNNRVFKRLRSITSPEMSDAELRDLARESVLIKTCVIESWVLRDIFESYAKAMFTPVFDLKAER